MKYINPNSETGLVNLFADFILSEINKDNESVSVIKVTKYEPFFVVEGRTSSKDVLDLNEISNKFVKKYSHLISDNNLKINIIDLIKYNMEITPVDYYNINFFSSERPLFSEEQINHILNENYLYETVDFNDSIELETLHKNSIYPILIEYNNKINYGCISSEFPYGFSLSMGRDMFYYLEYISNQVLTSSKSNSINFKYIKDYENDTFEILIDCDGPYPNEKNKSIILDVFDFNLKKFTKDYLIGYDYYSDIENQISVKPWLVKDKLQELFII